MPVPLTAAVLFAGFTAPMIDGVVFPGAAGPPMDVPKPGRRSFGSGDLVCPDGTE
jgi:hypothetical protein